MDDIVVAAKKAQIHDLIMTLPKQYQTVIGDGGHNLSVGEKQRIAISRLFQKPAINLAEVVFPAPDEPIRAVIFPSGMVMEQSLRISLS